MEEPAKVNGPLHCLKENMRKSPSRASIAVAIILSVVLVMCLILLIQEFRLRDHQVYHLNAARHRILNKGSASERALNIGHDQIMSFLDGACQVKKGQPTEGLDNYYCIAEDVFLSIRSDGKDIFQATAAIYRINSSSGRYDLYSIRPAVQFLQTIVPTWPGIEQELSSQIQLLRLKPEMRNTLIRDNKRIDLLYKRQKGMIVDGFVIVVEPI